MKFTVPEKVYVDYPMTNHITLYKLDNSRMQKSEKQQSVLNSKFLNLDIYEEI